MESRTKNAERNLCAAAAYQIVNVIVKFGLRTIFVYCLGKEYLGIDGVFSNVLSILSLAELGLGAAIVYDMYKPVAEGDERKVCQYIRLYKVVFRTIGVIILLMGGCLTPFLDRILTDIPNVKYIKVIYFLSLFRTSVSYFWAEYISLIGIYQMDYIHKIYSMFFTVIKSVIEGLLILVTHHYIAYLLMDIAMQIIFNYCIYRKAKVLFPFLAGKASMPDKADILRIGKSSLGAFSIRFSRTVLGATDNLIISAMISTVLVGIYSNYDIILQLILAYTVMIKNAFAGGVGNLCAGKNDGKKYEVFEKIYFIYGSIYMVAFVCLINLLEPLITLWLGAEYHLDSKVIVIAVFNCYLSGMLQPIEIYTYADGLFSYYKWKPWIEAAINLISSVILAKQYGLSGVFAGTVISKLSTSIWFDAYILYRYSFRVTFVSYVKMFFKYLGITAITAVVSKAVLYKIILPETQVILFLEKIVISLGLTLIIWWCAFRRTEQFRFYKKMIKNRLKK